MPKGGVCVRAFCRQILLVLPCAQRMQLWGNARDRNKRLCVCVGRSSGRPLEADTPAVPSLYAVYGMSQFIQETFSGPFTLCDTREANQRFIQDTFSGPFTLCETCEANEQACNESLLAVYDLFADREQQL